MEEKYSGIVLNAISFGESDKILNIYTLEKGLISAKIKGVKKAGAKLKFASEPFCFAEFLFASIGDKRIVTGASLIDSFYPVREDIVKFYSASVVLEFIKKFAKEEIVSPNLFMLAINTLKEMAYFDENCKYSLIRFLVSALTLTGYGLNIEGCCKCKIDKPMRFFFSTESGSFICENCFDGYGREINYYTFKTLKDIVNGKKGDDEFTIKVLKLLKFYITTKVEVEISSLNELISL